MFSGKSILITGGTGSFGKHFVRTLIDQFELERLIIYSRDELKQFEMQTEFNHPCMRWFLGDVRDQARLDQAMRDVDIVVHTAALKQVPAAEYNPMECINTNVIGAENVIKAALNNEVEKVLALSTDKAVNPINLYGATKLLSDKLFIAANNIRGTHKTIFSVARWGNVMGSRGSIIPYFKKLIREGAKALPITDRQMTRFWITLDQGTSFAINILEAMKGGEIFIPKMPSVRIIDIAGAMLPEGGVDIIGIRPGEKLHEVICSVDDAYLTLEFKDCYVIKPAIKFFSEPVAYDTNPAEETAVPVNKDFQYDSLQNSHFLSVSDLKTLIMETADSE